MHVSPVLIDCNFEVDSDDEAGLGIVSLKGPAVSEVFMNTSATPADGNPNPAAGIIVVKLSDNYSRIYSIDADISGPLGASTTSAKADVINIISVLGTATLAEWQAAGLPAGITPALGVQFIGANSSAIGGSAQTAVAAAAGSGIDHIETVGNPNLMIESKGSAVEDSLAGQGAVIYLRCYKDTVLTAPADGSTIRLRIYLSNSSVMISGE